MHRPNPFNPMMIHHARGISDSLLYDNVRGKITLNRNMLLEHGKNTISSGRGVGIDNPSRPLVPFNPLSLSLDHLSLNLK